MNAIEVATDRVIKPDLLSDFWRPRKATAGKVAAGCLMDESKLIDQNKIDEAETAATNLNPKTNNKLKMRWWCEQLWNDGKMVSGWDKSQ